MSKSVWIFGEEEACNRFRGDGKKKMRRGGEDELEPTENETRWKSLKLGARESHAEGRSRIRGKEGVGKARKEHQFLELSLTIRGLSG